MSKDTEDKLTPEALKHMMLDHMANTMPIPVDRDYAEHLLDRLIKSYAKDYAEMVVGANEAVGLPTTQAQEQRNYDKKVRNSLRAEQRERMQ